MPNVPGLVVRVGSHQNRGVLEVFPESCVTSPEIEAVEVKDNRELFAWRAILWSPDEGGSGVALRLLTPGLRNGQGGRSSLTA